MVQGQKDINPPNSVSKAIKILWISIAIGIPNCIYGLVIGKLILSMFFVIIFVAVMGTMSGTIIMISKGRNWARIIFLVTYILGVFIAIPIMLNDYKTNNYMGYVNILQSILQLIGVYLLFKKESSEWFKSKKLIRKSIAV